MLRRSTRLAAKGRAEKLSKVSITTADPDPDGGDASTPAATIKRVKRQTSSLNGKHDHGDGDVKIKKEVEVRELESAMPEQQSHRSNMYIGCHTSISGGIWKAPLEAAEFGAKAFGLFLHNQQQWLMKPLVDGHAEKFRETCKKLKFESNQIIPHGSYLMNCGSPKEEVKKKSVAMLAQELQRCEDLGLLYFNFHPGSTLGKIPIEECLSAIANAINQAHRATKYVIVLLENMSCQGNTVGGKLVELKAIIDQVDDKSRIGVCIDTCHSHAAGYDLSSMEGYTVFMNDIETIIGWNYVKAFHLNDSKGPSGCHKDRHENIGKGTIGIEGFRRIMNDSRMERIPMILETPYKSDDIYKDEIQLLYSLME